MIKYLVLLITLVNTLAFAETILVIDTVEQKERTNLLIRKAKERGATIVFYPPRGTDPGEKFTEGALSVLKTIKYDTLVMTGHYSNNLYFNAQKQTRQIETNKVFEAMKENAYAQKNCKSYLGLGCNTVCPDEAHKFKAALPKMEIAYGYCKSADSGNRKEALEYIESYFDKRDGIFKQNSASEIKSYLDTFNGITESNASIWFQCKEEAYVYSNDEDLKESVLESENQEDCKLKVEKYINQGQLYKKFLEFRYGNQSLPSDTEKGELRAMYNIVNKNKHCFESENFYFGGLFNLLFMKGYKTSFINYYSDVARELLKRLEAVTSSDIEGSLKKKVEAKRQAMATCKSNLGQCEIEFRKSGLTDFAEFLKDAESNLTSNQEVLAELSKDSVRQKIKDAKDGLKLMADPKGKHALTFPQLLKIESGLRVMEEAIPELGAGINQFGYAFKTLTKDGVLPIGWHEGHAAIPKDEYIQKKRLIENLHPLHVPTTMIDILWYK